MIMGWFRKIMYGRYGLDQLSVALLILSVIMSLVGRIGQWVLVQILSWIPIIFCYFRVFSKNLYARGKENAVFLRYWTKIKASCRSFVYRMKSAKTYRFFKCPTCSQRLRVPKGKGKISITCPKCGNSFIGKS